MVESGLGYLATPYSHADPDIRKRRYIQAAQAAAVFYKHDIHVFCPIAHSHPIAVHGDCPYEWPQWIEADLKFLKVCDWLAVVQLPGWERSGGVNREIHEARILHKTVFYLPENFTDGNVYGRFIAAIRKPAVDPVGLGRPAYPALSPNEEFMRRLLRAGYGSPDGSGAASDGQYSGRVP